MLRDQHSSVIRGLCSENFSPSRQRFLQLPSSIVFPIAWVCALAASLCVAWWPSLKAHAALDPSCMATSDGIEGGLHICDGTLAFTF